MKIRLLADDSKIPNIAIMKISTYHKQLGDDVDWYNPLFDYDCDILYHSRIFSFTQPYQYYPSKAIIYKGGTGFDLTSKLPDEIESIKELDYSLYPNCDYSLQFLSRGCIRNCPFCVVQRKEGLIHQVEPMNLNPNGKFIMLLDNNFFACKEWRENVEILKSYNQPIDFNQGIDLRILTEEQCKALKSLKIKTIHCAWDNYEDKDVILPKLKMLANSVNKNKITCYVLVGNKENKLLDTDVERVKTIWEIGAYPFVMPYVNPLDHAKREIPQDIKDFARWCNNRFVFKSCSWEEYKNGI